MEAPAIENLSAILTCCGGPEQPNKHLSVRLYRCGGVTKEEMSDLTDGDIGEALLQRAGLSPQQQEQFDTIMKHWTCIEEKHYRDCAANAAESDNPGVVMVAVGSNKLKTIRETIRRGLVNHLFIDVDLAEVLAAALANPTAAPAAAAMADHRIVLRKYPGVAYRLAMHGPPASPGRRSSTSACDCCRKPGSAPRACWPTRRPSPW